tara:strand:+ start:11727 stop:14834 length:3108 start_codon:yes stop_codon:yes gene_type:complete
MSYSTTDSNLNISTANWSEGISYKKYDIVNGSNISVFNSSSSQLFIPSTNFIVADSFVRIKSGVSKVVGYSKPFLMKDLSTGYCLSFSTWSTRPSNAANQPLVQDGAPSRLSDPSTCQSIKVELEILSFSQTPIQPNIEKNILISINEYAKTPARDASSAIKVSQVFTAEYFQPNSRVYNGTYNQTGGIFGRIKLTKSSSEDGSFAEYYFDRFSLSQLDEHENDLYFYSMEEHMSDSNNSPFFHMGGDGLDSDAFLNIQPNSSIGGQKISLLSSDNWLTNGSPNFKSLYDGRSVCLMNSTSDTPCSISSTMKDLVVGQEYRVDLSLNPVRESKTSYSNWSAGEPNNWGGAQDFAYILKKPGVNAGTWDDGGGGEFAQATDLSIPKAAGFIVQHGGPYSSNYEAVLFQDSDERSWANARNLARSNNYTSDLAVVLVPEQQTAFESLVSTLNFEYNEYYFWIGLTDTPSDITKGFCEDGITINPSGSWMWIEGTPHSSSTGLSRDAEKFSNSPYGANIKVYGENYIESDPTTYVVHHEGLKPGDFTFYFTAESESLNISIDSIQPPSTAGIFEENNTSLLELPSTTVFGDNVFIENCIQLNHIIVSKEMSLWTRHFTPNPSYGSSIRLSANNSELIFGDGYSEIRPKNLNSVLMEADLSFQNRGNLETKAIIHFLENTQGYKKLKYRAPAPFNKLQSFTCDSFSHTYNDYDDNSLSVKLVKDDGFILNRFNDFLMPHPGNWKDSSNYFENDIVIHQSKSADGSISSPTTRSFFYAFSENKNNDPLFSSTTWTKNHFFWVPSQNNTFNRESRKHSISMENDFVGRSSDGTFPNLLELDLVFDARTDFEARSIMHFLTNKMGHIPFLFNLPEPYSNLKTEPLRDSLGKVPKISASAAEVSVKGSETTLLLENPLMTPSGSANPGHELLLKNQVITVPSLPSSKNKFYISKPMQINGATQLNVHNPFYSVEDIGGREINIHVQQKAFYCDQWSINYKSFNNNSVRAVFKEIAIAPTLISEFIDITIGEDETNQYIDLSSY